MISQKSNADWWSSNPMTYDWEGKIQEKQGAPEFFRQSDLRALEAHRPFGHPSFPNEKAYSRLIRWEEVSGQQVLEEHLQMSAYASSDVYRVGFLDNNIFIIVEARGELTNSYGTKNTTEEIKDSTERLAERLITFLSSP